jgi:tetratricopeptide (TPR) repeat protein
MDEKENPDLFEATRVDLGDDLLEKTAVLEVPASRTEAAAPVQQSVLLAPPPVQITDPQDSFESARILFSEGFLEEAKQLLRKILMEDSSHAGAKAKLAEIHELELKQLLEDRMAPRPRRMGTQQPEPTLRLDRIDPETIARDLEKDLGLEESPLTIVADAANEAKFIASIRSTLRKLQAREQIDLGIGFLEMGLGAAASIAFEAATEDQDLGQEARLLLAQAHIAHRKLGEAELVLDEVLSRNVAEIPGPIGTEARYWMGRILEERGRWDQAAAWYQEVARLDATHRDTLDRLRILSVRAGGA